MMLEVKSVSKMYSPTLGLRNASFTGEEGDIIALVGPNGAGKTTLLSVLCDQQQCDDGSCMLNGKPLHLQKERIGVLMEHPYFVEAMKSIEYLRFIAALKGISSFGQIESLINRLNASRFINQKISHLSQGQRKRLALITALMGDPYLLMLDEPTNGFDTETILQLKTILDERRENKQITIFSSHVLDFVKSVATKVIFIKNGSTTEIDMASGSLEAFYRDFFGLA